MSNLETSRAQRLDQKAVELVPAISRAFAAKLIEQGKVSVDGEIVLKPGYKLKFESDVKVDFDPSELEKIPDINLPILYEDDDCVVINKPAGVLTHSKGAFNPEPTVSTWLRNHLAQEDVPPNDEKDGVINNRAGIVHRLDRATSGVMICAKNPKSLSWLQKQFSQRKVKKSYVAIVTGELNPAHAIIDMPIERNPKAPATFRVGANGKSAVTEYEVESSDGKYSLVKLTPATGRTHQLRVHLAQAGHPIVGDTLYGGEAADRLYLHALELELTLPNRERKIFKAPLPDEFQRKMEQGK